MEVSAFQNFYNIFFNKRCHILSLKHASSVTVCVSIVSTFLLTWKLSFAVR